MNIDKKGRGDNPMYHKFEYKPKSVYQSFIAIPIRWKNKSVGVLSLESFKRKAFNKEEELWHQMLADVFGNVLYHFGKVH